VASKDGHMKYRRDASGNIIRWLPHFQGEYLGSYATEDEALDQIAAARKIAAGIVPDTLRLYGERWMKSRESEIRRWNDEKSVWDMHIATAPFYDWPLKKLEVDAVEAWLKALQRKRKTIVRRTRAGIVRLQGEDTLSEQTIKHARRILSGCLKQALKDKKVKYNAAALASMPKDPHAEGDEEEEEWTFLFVEEIAALFAAIEAIVPADPAERLRLGPARVAWLERRCAFYRAVYAVAIYGGLRQGEIFGLEWTDVYFDARGGGDRQNTLMVRKTRNMGRRPKGGKTKPVPMLAPLRAALDAWRRIGGVLKTHGKCFPADGTTGRGARNQQVPGGYYSESYDAGWEKRWRARATGRAYVNFHDLRHTCGSHLVMGTWGRALALTEVQEWLRHKDLKSTQRYAHLAPGHMTDRAAEMDAAMGWSRASVREAEMARQAALYTR
jgi:integrase